MPFMFIPINMVPIPDCRSKTAQASALINVARNLGSISVSLANTELVQPAIYQSRLVENLMHRRRASNRRYNGRNTLRNLARRPARRPRIHIGT
jgi:hypothetical protein